MKFEINVTVLTNNINQFKKDCEILKIKPILIDTLKNETQLMTSSKYDCEDYNKTLTTLKNQLTSMGYDVLRRKVEKFPDEIPNKDFLYYESHLRLKLKKDFNFENLKRICELRKFHISKIYSNLLKNIIIK